MFKIEKTATSLHIISPYWTVCHTLDRGGVVKSIEILHGTRKNLLLSPMESRIDEKWTESADRFPMVNVRRHQNCVTVKVEGYLCDLKGKRGPIAYKHIYRYGPFSIKHELTLLPQHSLRIHTLTALRMLVSTTLNEYSWGSTEWERVKPRYMHVIGPHCDDIWGRIPKSKGDIELDFSRPWQVALFQRNGEGFQWCGDSHEYAWNRILGTHNKGHYQLYQDKEGVLLELSPLQGEEKVIFNTPVKLGWYLILPNIPEYGHRKYYEVAVGTCPFPSNERLQAWASAGVNLIRIHDDTDRQKGTNEYWHDGEFPPYSPAKMKKLEDFIKSCHKLGMRIVPYFSGWELSPEASVFARYAGNWYAPSQSNGRFRYTPYRGGGVYGALMCPDSGWGSYLERYIKRCVDELGFDGYYLDWSGPGVCKNCHHLPGEHNGIDGLVRLLERTREWLGASRLLIIHSGGQAMWLLHHNVADQIVTLEEGKKIGGYTPQTPMEYPPSVLFMPATSVSIVPNILHDTCKEKSPRVKLYRGLSHLVLLNALPYSYHFEEVRAFGCRNWQELVKDNRGLYAAFRIYGSYDWTKYRFFDGFSGAVKTFSRHVGAALYARPGEGIIVVSNMSHSPVRGGQVKINPNIAAQYNLPTTSSYPKLKAFEFKLSPLN